MLLEEVAEAVAHRDLRDLREAPQIPLLSAASPRRQCCTSAAKALLADGSAGTAWTAVVRASSELQAVLELGDAQLELLELGPEHEAELAQDALEAGPARSRDARRVAAPARRRRR